jgi:hypothetical protein
MTPESEFAPKSWLKDAAFGGFFLLLALLIYRTPLLQGRELYFRDFQLFYTPMKHFLAEAIRHGEWAFWNPHALMGSPFMADPQSGVLYPASLLLLAAKATPTAMILSLVFHITLAQMGLYALARHYQLGRLAAATGAVIYGLGGWMISAGNVMTEIHSAAWVPWTLLACECLWMAPSLRKTALAAAVIAMQMLAGWPEMFVMLGLIFLVRRLALPGLLSAPWLPLSLVAGLLAAMLFSPQLLSTWEAYVQSVRVGGMSEAEMLAFSATLPQWRSLVQAPALSSGNWNIFSVFPDGHVPLTLSLYVGPLVIVLGLLGLLSRRRLAWSWLVLVLVGVFLALGSNNPMAVALLKLLNRFRSPEKYLFLVHFGLALLAALGMARLSCWIRRPRWSAVIGVVLLGAISLDLITTNDDIDLSAEKGYYDLSLHPEAVLLQQNPGRVYSRSVATGTDVQPLYAAFQAALSPNTGIGDGISHVNGIFFMALHQQAQASRLLEGVAPGVMLANHLGFLGTQYVVTDDPAFAQSTSWQRQARQLSDKLWQLEQSAPLLGFPQRVEPREDDYLYSAIEQNDFSSGHTVFVPPAHLGAAVNQEGTVNRRSERPGLIDADVHSPTGGLLVLRQSNYPGWHVSVDGVETELIPSNYFFIGVNVPAGAHRVQFRFEPSYWRHGLALSAAALLILVVLLASKARFKAIRAV